MVTIPTTPAPAPPVVFTLPPPRRAAGAREFPVAEALSFRTQITWEEWLEGHLAPAEAGLPGLDEERPRAPASLTATGRFFIPQQRAAPVPARRTERLSLPFSVRRPGEETATYRERMEEVAVELEPAPAELPLARRTLAFGPAPAPPKPPEKRRVHIPELPPKRPAAPAVVPGPAPAPAEPVAAAAPAPAPEPAPAVAAQPAAALPELSISLTVEKPGLLSAVPMFVWLGLAVVAALGGTWYVAMPKPEPPKLARPSEDRAPVGAVNSGWDNLLAGGFEASLKGRQLSLFRAAEGMSNYRYEFKAAIESRGLGWAYRVKDANNYYATRIEISPAVGLYRWSVVGGKETAKVRLPLPVQVGPDTVYAVTLEAGGDKFTTRINGQIVDVYTDNRLRTGGVGMLQDAGDRTKIHAVQVRVPKGIGR